MADLSMAGEKPGLPRLEYRFKYNEGRPAVSPGIAHIVTQYEHSARAQNIERIR